MQKPSQCAVAACASVANYFNPELNYEITEKVAKKTVARNLNDGLYSGQIGCLLNNLGFQKVTIISSDLDYLDYSWAGLSQARLVEEIRKAQKKLDHSYDRGKAKHSAIFLEKESYQNKLVIDYNFGKYIREHLDAEHPLLLSFNWTLFFKYAKTDDNDDVDPFKGETVDHAVCCSGYSRNGVYIVDSHHEEYKYRLKKFRKGYYHVRWEQLMTCIGMGDIYLAESYSDQLLTAKSVSL